MKITKSKLRKLIRETFYNHPELGTFKPKDHKELVSIDGGYYSQLYQIQFLQEAV